MGTDNCASKTFPVIPLAVQNSLVLKVGTSEVVGNTNIEFFQLLDFVSSATVTFDTAHFQIQETQFQINLIVYKCLDFKL